MLPSSLPIGWQSSAILVAELCNGVGEFCHDVGNDRNRNSMTFEHSSNGATNMFIGKGFCFFVTSYTFYLLMRMISCYTVYTEKQQSEGRVDCIVETPDYIYIFEFKLDGTADEALAQIEEKGYARPYEADNRPLHKIGVSFSSETGTVSDWKVNPT